MILPDVRGLYRFYEELALRFAERGYPAVAFDYFGRTAGVEKRDDDFDYMPHVQQTTPEGIQADVARSGRAPARARRDVDLHRRLLLRRPQLVARRRAAATASPAPSASTAGRASATASPGPTHAPPRSHAPILALQAGDDANITAEHNAAFDAALDGGRRRARGRHLRGRAAQLLRPQAGASSPTHPTMRGAGVLAFVERYALIGLGGRPCAAGPLGREERPVDLPVEDRDVVLDAEPQDILARRSRARPQSARV